MRLLFVFDVKGSGSGFRYKGRGVLESIEGVGGSVLVDGLSQLLDVVGRGVSTVGRASATLGCSKSHATPCLVQFPHLG